MLSGGKNSIDLEIGQGAQQMAASQTPPSWEHSPLHRRKLRAGGFSTGRALRGRTSRPRRPTAPAPALAYPADHRPDRRPRSTPYDDDEAGWVLGAQPELSVLGSPLTPARRERLATINAALYLRRPLLVTGPPGVPANPCSPTRSPGNSA